MSKFLSVTAHWMAERFTGSKEVPGTPDNPQILAMLKLDADWPIDDEVPWCSAFVNYVCWLVRLPRSKSLRARSWLRVGKVIAVEHACVGFDVIVLNRGSGKQPGPDVIDAPGHVGFFAGKDDAYVYVLGGNQNDGVNTQAYPLKRVLGVRRLR